MNKTQLTLALSAIGLVFMLYFGCETKSREQKKMLKSRELTNETTASLDINSLLTTALVRLDSTQKGIIKSLTEKAQQTGSGQAQALKTLSGKWYEMGGIIPAAIYAEEVANLEKTDSAWSIVGGNYFLALQQSTDKGERDFCSQKAATAFQNAASLAPDKLEYKVNMALCSVENPPANNPMKGILTLRELDAQYPDNNLINMQLARLAIKTGQFEKALVRLEKILAREPQNQKAACMALMAYENTNNTEKANEMKKICGK